MANNGYGRDTLLLKRMIRENTILTIYKDDKQLVKLIKKKLNEVIYSNIRTSYRWNSKTYTKHSVWLTMRNTIWVVNKLRQQNWFWDYLKYK